MGMLMDILGGVGDVLDTPGRFTRTALAGRNPFSSVFDPSKGVSGRDLLQQYGMVGQNQEGLDGGDIGGFLAEMLLDPTNLIGGGLLARLLGKAGKAKAANRAIRQIPRELPSRGWVHGAPVESLNRYLNEGIPITNSEEGLATFLGRLDHPTGYQGSMTAVGGFGPRTRMSDAIDKNTIGLGRERFGDDRIAYVLSPEIPAVKRSNLDWVDMFVQEHPKMLEAWEKSGAVLKHSDSEKVLREIRPELLAKIKASQNFAMSRSHRIDPEAIVVKALADKAATPEQITALISDGQLPSLFSVMKAAGRQLPVYDSLGHLRLRPRELSQPSAKPLLAALLGQNTMARFGRNQQSAQ